MNPFISGNPSVSSYEKPPVDGRKIKTHDDFEKPTKAYTVDKHKCDAIFEKLKNTHTSNQYSLFRTTAQMAHNGSYGAYESISEDGCSPDYLFAARKVAEHDFCMLKIKIPTNFIHSDNPDITYGVYKLQELVIDSSEIMSNGCSAVTSRQLNDYKDSDGYAYVFFATDEFVEKLCAEQSPPSGIPPIYTLGEYIGYVLRLTSKEDGPIVFIRHRGCSPDWEGNLINTQCYIKNENLKPIIPSDLGEYFPELYGDTMKSFKAGRIGPFRNKKKLHL